MPRGGLQSRHAAIAAPAINSAQWSFADLQAFCRTIW